MEEEKIREIVTAIFSYCSNVIVIDDGSHDRTTEEAISAGAKVLQHTTNYGKGIALHTGFTYAQRNGFDFIITMDGDGQHSPKDIPKLINAYKDSDAPVIIGTRMHDSKSMPVIRRLTNHFMSWMLSRMMNQVVPDTQCGYRLYATNVLTKKPLLSRRFATESEILLNLSSNRVKIGSVPITVIYRNEKSKISAIRDTFRFITMLFRWKINQTRLLLSDKV